MDNKKNKLGATQKKAINDEPANHKASLGARSKGKHARDEHETDGDTSMTAGVEGAPKKRKCRKDGDSAPNHDASNAAAHGTHEADDEHEHDIDKDKAEARAKELAISRGNTSLPCLEKMICAWCGEKATRKCSACSSINYCSRACQAEDFAVHELACAMFSKFLCESPRPSSEHRIVIYLPEKGRRPCLRWFNNDPSTDEYQEDLKNMIGGHPCASSSGINYRTKKGLQHGLVCYYDDKTCLDECEANQSVEKATERKSSLYISGSIAVGSDSGEDTIEDADIEMNVVDVALVDATAETYRHFIDAMLFGKGDALPAFSKSDYR